MSYFCRWSSVVSSGMSALQDDQATAPPSDDAVVARLDVIVEELAAVVGDEHGGFGCGAD